MSGPAPLHSNRLRARCKPGSPITVEARHKEGGGGDHVAVAWSGPGISQRLIPGLYLAPFAQNYAPSPGRDLHRAAECLQWPRQSVWCRPPTQTRRTRTVAGRSSAGRAWGPSALTRRTGRVFVTRTTRVPAGASYTLQVHPTDTSSTTGQMIRINIVNCNRTQPGGGCAGILQRHRQQQCLRIDLRSSLPEFTERHASAFVLRHRVRLRAQSRLLHPRLRGAADQRQLRLAATGDDETPQRLSTDANPSYSVRVVQCRERRTPRSNWTTFPSQTLPSAHAGGRAALLHRDAAQGRYRR